MKSMIKAKVEPFYIIYCCRRGALFSTVCLWINLRGDTDRSLWIQGSPRLTIPQLTIVCNRSERKKRSLQVLQKRLRSCEERGHLKRTISPRACQRSRRAARPWLRRFTGRKQSSPALAVGGKSPSPSFSPLTSQSSGTRRPQLEMSQLSMCLAR